VYEPSTKSIISDGSGAPRFLGVKELASYLDIHPSTVYRWVREQKRQQHNGPPAHRIGGKIRFYLPDVDEWFRQQRILRDNGSEITSAEALMPTGGKHVK
jgi:excisionase family DNA binding protein